MLSAILLKNGSQLDDDSLHTYMLEAEAVVNSRPLTTENLSSPSSVIPISPQQLLTLKTKVLLPPPGIFEPADLYSKKRWRRVQHLANEFWQRWRKDFLLRLQERKKWQRPERNSTVGDVVLLNEENHPRCDWRLARIVETFPEADGFVRKVKLQMATSFIDSKGIPMQPLTFLFRPIHKLVLLHAADESSSSLSLRN